MRPRRPSTRERRAFTLVELLVTMSIIALLVGILMPTFNSIKEDGRNTKCLTNLRAIGSGLAQYSGPTNNNYFPPGEYNTGSQTDTWATILAARGFIDYKAGSSHLECPSEVRPPSTHTSAGGLRLDCWYGVNGTTGTSPEKYVMSRNIVIQSTSISRPGETVAVYDGPLMHDGDTSKVSFRHRGGRRINVIFVSLQADTAERTATFPDLTCTTVSPRFRAKD